jgi:adenine-specific DNA-methyltransferase
MTAVFDYYKLANEAQGVSSGFIYKTVPHITLKSIANNEPPATETLYDQPETDKSKIRIAGPFTVEALPSPVGETNVAPIAVDSSEFLVDSKDSQLKTNNSKLTDWCDELQATGVIERGGKRLEFSRVGITAEMHYLQAEAETKEARPRQAVVCFAGETKPLDAGMVSQALSEVSHKMPLPALLIFAAFQFDSEAGKVIELNAPSWEKKGLTILKAQMNTDLLTTDLKKKVNKSQSFWLVGQPDVELRHEKDAKGKPTGKYQVEVRGYDYYNVTARTVDSRTPDNIAMWLIDTDYDGLCVEPSQVFFPMDGKNAWKGLAASLKAQLNTDKLESYAGTVSLPFEVKSKDAEIAVKIVDDRGIESLKLLCVRDAK